MTSARAKGLLDLDDERLWLTPRGRLLASEALVDFVPLPV